jgi:toxin HigB-1
VIISFKDKATEAVFQRQPMRRLGPDVQKAAYRKLVMLHLAETLDELRFPPGNRLEKLSHDRNGQHSLRVNDQWRVCFVWTAQGARDVEIVDYH